MDPELKFAGENFLKANNSRAQHILNARLINASENFCGLTVKQSSGVETKCPWANKSLALKLFRDFREKNL